MKASSVRRTVYLLLGAALTATLLSSPTAGQRKPAKQNRPKPAATRSLVKLPDPQATYACPGGETVRFELTGTRPNGGHVGVIYTTGSPTAPAAQNIQFYDARVLSVLTTEWSYQSWDGTVLCPRFRVSERVRYIGNHVVRVKEVSWAECRRGIVAPKTCTSESPE